jgi:predicted RNA binding protein YcfA (HicA-like mRNA interferase family)
VTVDPVGLLARIRQGARSNVRFADARRLVEALGFELLRTSGSHHVFGRPGIPELINLQDDRGQAKPYQLRQIARLVDRYALEVEER